MESILAKLYEYEDKEYAVFQSKLTPTIDPGTFIGVRVPHLRKLAKELVNTPEAEAFMNELPHKYYDENMLHAAIITEVKDYETSLKLVESFLPYVDNWAVCDTMHPKAFKKHKGDLIPKVKAWIGSKETYTCRFGMEMLMALYLDGDFEAEYLELPAGVHSEEYYVNMMAAWYYATALAKQWDATIPYIEQNRLDAWVHNKTIQKARESYRVTPERKEYLKSLKRL